MKLKWYQNRKNASVRRLILRFGKRITVVSGCAFHYFYRRLIGSTIEIEFRLIPEIVRAVSCFPSVLRRFTILSPIRYLKSVNEESDSISVNEKGYDSSAFLYAVPSEICKINQTESNLQQ